MEGTGLIKFKLSIVDISVGVVKFTAPSIGISSLLHTEGSVLDANPAQMALTSPETSNCPPINMLLTYMLGMSDANFSLGKYLFF